MTARDDFDRVLTGWLRDEAAGSGAEYLDQALARVDGVEQRRFRARLVRLIPTGLGLRRLYIAPPLRLALLLVLLTVALVGALALVGARPRSWFTQPSTGALAFAANGALYFADADGSNPRTVIGGTHSVSYPAWSPDGSRLAFFDSAATEQGSLWVAHADGTNLRKLVDGVSSRYPASWSPDGRRLVFGLGFPQRDPDKAWPGDRLYLVDVETGARERIPYGSFPSHGAAWSPDGEWLAVLGAEPRTPYRGVLEVMRPDGSERVRVSSVDVAYQTLPAWSPDGTALAYGGDTAGLPNRAFIHVAERVDGTWRERALSHRPRERFDVWDGAPSWSHDGTRIAFIRNPALPTHAPFTMVPGRFYVHLVPRSGTTPARPLVVDKTMGAGVCWTADDKLIGFALRDVTGPNQFAIVDVAAAEERDLPTVAEVGRTIAIPAHETPVYFSACSWQQIP